MRLRSAADSFKPVAGEAPSDAPKMSAGRGRGRGRGRGGRGKGKQKAQGSDEEEDQEGGGSDADLDQEDQKLEQELEAEEGTGEDEKPKKTPKKPNRRRRGSLRTPKRKSKTPKRKRTPKLKRALKTATADFADSVTFLHLQKATTNPLDMEFPSISSLIVGTPRLCQRSKNTWRPGMSSYDRQCRVRHTSICIYDITLCK